MTDYKLQTRARHARLALQKQEQESWTVPTYLVYLHSDFGAILESCALALAISSHMKLEVVSLHSSTNAQEVHMLYTALEVSAPFGF